ncbi:RlpA-like double-psi beta-barrel-protein domain-containing protein-containing protein [Desarmillaria tabescens]|uniref:RlpA-like double-psi beta-barrel-protein domain-containing protein-containing protein n=1 Tax=Armillaria tabescens TaxID=1929756 RepID=A0AA39JT64_ARMTA|nr:RlpA-like double-psi beta-barrel-protein domain-containing protein-containing protein [Desarmillaria tabescens]KAK0448480.1 RlpA-like double-psi beta-barrel-protein domain-containing protein-containing protein [Desarmillaria tabescens]
MMFSSCSPSNSALSYLFSLVSVSAVSMNLARQQDPGSQVWPQTTQTTTTTLGIDPNTGQPYTTPVTSETYSSSTSTSTAGSPTATIAVEPLDGEHSGDGTFYTPGLGACGQNNTEADPIAAVSYLLFDYFPGSTTSNPNKNPICGKKLVAHYTDPDTQQQTTTQEVTIVDRCAGCEIRWSVDFSPTVFSTLASKTLGRINITWSFVDEIGGETLAVPNTSPVQREFSREEGRSPEVDSKKKQRAIRWHRDVPLEIS